jgi:hypothetical protein
VDGHPFQFVTEIGPDAEPTYVLLNIDHVIVAGIEGECEAEGPDGRDDLLRSHAYRVRLDRFDRLKRSLSAGNSG